MTHTVFWAVFLTCVGLILLILVAANLTSSLQLELDPPVRALNFNAHNVQSPQVKFARSTTEEDC